MRVAAAASRSPRPIDRVWAVVSDPERMLSFMSGVTRWEVEGDREPGLGARYRVLFRVGAAEIGGLIEVVECDEPRELAWTSVLGIDQRGRWRLRELPGGRTRVELRMAYGVAGSGLGAGSPSGSPRPTVSGHLRRSLHAAQAPGRARAAARARRGQALRPRGVARPAASGAQFHRRTGVPASPSLSLLLQDLLQHAFLELRCQRAC